MTRDAIKCFVLMPFKPELNLVYQYGIKPAIKKLDKDYNIETEIERADDKLSVDRDKVETIANSIKSSELIIIDITGFNPNVLWELGYCTALSKNLILISQNSSNLPFNITTRDIYTYEFSYEGLEKMQVELPKKIENIVNKIQKTKHSLRYENETEILLSNLLHGLELIDINSILTSFAKNELRRLAGRIDDLKVGVFELRNIKPIKEIIEYYCDYLSQLNNEDCSYDTISFDSFWNKITNDAKDFKYLEENLNAANRGTKVRRIFLLDKSKYPDQKIPKSDNLNLILEKHFDAMQEFNENSDYMNNFQVRLYFSKAYNSDLTTYKNFALWKKDSELILFEPIYDDSKDMSSTKFFYCDLKGRTNLNHKKKYDNCKEGFERLWKISTKLSLINFD